MIEQLHYAPTSRYNFLQTMEESELPERLTDLSLKSMHNARGMPFQPYGPELLESLVERSQCDETINLNHKAFTTLLAPLKPLRDGTPIVAVDVSSIRIGETETGVLCAVRGAVVQNKMRQYRFLRIGPLPFHITEENKREILSLPGRDSPLSFSGSFTLLEAQSQLCSTVERWIQMGLSHSSRGEIILWDGSMTAGTAGSPLNVVSQILDAARKNSNSVLSFSKGTSIRFLGRRITDLAPRCKPPYVFEAENLPLLTSRNICSLGKIYIAKLMDGGFVFRVDIDRALQPELRIMAVQRLLGNELIFQGYPETLRLAHIYSTFTASEVMGIQRFVAREYGLKVIARPSVRRMLFGPFGTGMED